MIGVLVFFKEPNADFLFNANRTTEDNPNLCSSRLVTSTKKLSRFSFLKLEDIELQLDQNIEVFLFLGQAIIGFGAVVIYSIGIAYVEEITLKEQSSYCQAMFYGSGNFNCIANFLEICCALLLFMNEKIGSIGGGVGFLISGQFLNVNSRFYSSTYTSIEWLTPQSTFWIGAW